MSLKPCPVCGSAMQCYDTAAFSDDQAANSHYLLACVACGHGPTHAFESSHEAIQHWNHSIQRQEQLAEMP